MSWVEIEGLVALPVAVLVLALIGWASTRAATYFREKAHNERLARLADGVSRIAGGIADSLGSLPAGSNFAEIKMRLIDAGADTARKRFGETIESLGGANHEVLTSMVRGEMAKLPSAAGSLPDPTSSTELKPLAGGPLPRVTGLAP